MPQLPVILTTFANSYDDTYLSHLEEEHDRLIQILAPLNYFRHVPLSSAKSRQLVQTLTQYQEELFILHFGGHADEEHLYLKDGGGHVAGLAENLALHPNLKLVFLNGCNTQAQVRPYLNAEVPAVIATTCSVADGEAMRFADVFYTALATGHTLEEAFRRAKGAMKLKQGVTYREEIVNLRGMRLRETQIREVPWCLYVASDEMLEWKLNNERRNTKFLAPDHHGRTEELKQLEALAHRVGKTISGKKDTIIQVLKEPDFKDRFKMVCESLADDIRKIDKDTNWSARYYTPLEAEVELQDSNKRKKKIVADLLSALNQTKERLILVLGDPGAGKSVALRKLCLDLLMPQKALKKFIMPIYINLKEWSSEREWTEDEPPTVEEIKQFVIENLKNRDIVSRDFFHEHFDALYESGKLFFVLDSFDEIPAILGTSHDSLLIDKVSYVFTKFLKGARQPKAQGIISSREFRKPSDSFQSSITLFIRPLSEVKINTTFSRYGKIGTDKIKELFLKRPELATHSRNPFTATLISDYVYRNKGEIPQNLFLVYDSYIENMLNSSCREKMQRYNLNISEVKKFMIDFGGILFEKSSLEIPINELRNRIVSSNFDGIVEVLKFSRLCREGYGLNTVLSFSHRRFSEFFAACTLLEKEYLDELILSDIPSDSLWRDTLVLYCMVAPEDKATKIAEFCWEVLKNENSLLNNKSIHCLRFLVDGFSGRKTCLNSFAIELSEYIIRNINEDNIFTTIFATEALTLLSTEKIDEGIIKSLDLNNSWVFETALRTSRHLEKISDPLNNKIILSFNVKSISLLYSFLNLLALNKDEIFFSLSLSEAFRHIKTALKWLYVKTYISFLFALLFMAWVARQYIYYKDGIIDSIMTLNLIGQSYVLIIFLTFLFFLRLICDYFFMGALNFIYFSMNTSSPFVHSISGWNYKKLKVAFFLLIGLIAYSGFGILITKASVLLDKITGKNDSILLAILPIGMFIVIIINRKEFMKNNDGSFVALIKLVKAAINSLKKYNRSRIFFKRINFNNLNNREYIYECFINTYPHFSSNLLDYLEANVKEVTGEYPDATIYKVTSSTHLDRLAKLELKWRGLG